MIIFIAMAFIFYVLSHLPQRDGAYNINYAAPGGSVPIRQWLDSRDKLYAEQ